MRNIKVHSRLFELRGSGSCPVQEYEKVTSRHTRVTCRHCLRALVKMGKNVTVPGPQTMITISHGNLRSLKQQLAEARAWKRKAIKLLRKL